MKRLLITGWVPEDCVIPFRIKFEINMPDKETKRFSFNKVIDVIADYDALLCVGFACGKEVIDVAHRLKVIGNNGVGYNNIDWEYATQKGIFVVNTPNSVCEPTAEFTIALILAVVRGIVQYDKTIRKTKLCGIDTFFDRDMLIFGKTLGILGLGRIGYAVAKKAMGQGMQVIYYDPLRQTEKEQELGVRYAPFDEVVSTADVLTCHMPFIPENHHLINKEVFKKMKKSAYFINAARGGVMNEADLVEALKAGEIHGAAVDVYEFEPKVSEQLTKLDNIVLTPHVATTILEVRKNMVIEALTGIDGVLSGNLPYNVINPELFK